MATRDLRPRDRRSSSDWSKRTRARPTASSGDRDRSRSRHRLRDDSPEPRMRAAGRRRPPGDGERTQGRGHLGSGASATWITGMVPGSAVRSFVASVVELAGVLQLLEHRVDRRRRSPSPSGRIPPYLSGPPGWSNCAVTWNLPVRPRRFTEVDRGVDEDRVDLSGLERGVGVEQVLVHVRACRRRSSRAGRWRSCRSARPS